MAETCMDDVVEIKGELFIFEFDDYEQAFKYCLLLKEGF